MQWVVNIEFLQLIETNAGISKYEFQTVPCRALHHRLRAKNVA